MSGWLLIAAIVPIVATGSPLDPTADLFAVVGLLFVGGLEDLVTGDGLVAPAVDFDRNTGPGFCNRNAVFVA